MSSATIASSSSSSAAILITGLGLTFNLFRLACDLISSASARERNAWLSTTNDSNRNKNNGGGGRTISSCLTPDHFLKTMKRLTPCLRGYVWSVDDDGDPPTDDHDDEEKISLRNNTTTTTKTLPKGHGETTTTTTTTTASSTTTRYGSVAPTEEETITLDTTDDITSDNLTFMEWMQDNLPVISTVVQLALVIYFIVSLLLSVGDDVTATEMAACAGLAAVAGLIVSVRDAKRERFGRVQRVLYVMATGVLLVGAGLVMIESSKAKSTMDIITIIALLSYFLLSLGEVNLIKYPIQIERESKKSILNSKALLILLKPYFWPDATDSAAWLNRVRAILTWVCVISAKGCNLVAPIMIGRALTALSLLEYGKCANYSFLYVTIQFFGTFFKECQSLVYLKVSQAAFVQVAETVFRHIHQLSLDWHLRKKLGEVIRSMDRGIQACDTLMKYLFLWLIPAIVECLLVCILFASYFNYLPVAVAVFFFVFVYMVLTIVLTLWRKKFRKAVARSDNDWHDRCTDSLINFETVKYFTAEGYEMEKFGNAVKEYQTGSVNVAASLSILNISQRVISQACLGTVLALTALGIKNRMDCCLSNGLCTADNLLTCSSDISNATTCPGMVIGDFVAVMTYTINLFQPLNFLGSVYNAIVMSIIDLTNMAELLAENPDVVDKLDAIPLPKTNEEDPSVAVEFNHVRFHYPTQPPGSGLHDLSFTMKRGTVTALVGQTGAGKSTISRLLFRFYDALDGCVKVNGVDVRNVTQLSLREAIGVVPQAASLFNDTLRTNILYGRRDASEEELATVARDAQLETFVGTLKEGWETMVGDRGLKLSGGEKQRVAIARCLLKNPPFVVLDEATSALDTVTENSVQEALDRLGSERTCLVIAHRLGTIRNADNIIVLGNGGVLEQGTHDELLAKDGKYAEMWNMQLHDRVDSRGNLREL